MGLFGGTFNPIHHGHLIAVQEAAHQLELESVLFIPTGIPPHKETPTVSADHRLAMTRLSLENHRNFSVSTVELDGEEPSYTYDTLTRLRTQHPDRDLVFMTGSDELLQFTDWYEWEALLDEFTIAGMTRPGFDEDKIPDSVKRRSVFAEVPDIQISSSLIRERYANRDPVRFFLPRPVWEYINDHELYS